MTNPDTQSHGCADTGTSGDQYFAPCSCCMALARVRMPGAHSGGEAPPDSGGQSPPLNGHDSGHDNGHGQGHGNGNGNDGGKNRQKIRLSPLVFKMPNLKGKKQQQDSQEEKEDKQADPGAAAKDAASDNWEDDLAVPKKRRLWQGLDGIAVMLFGVVIPTLMTFSSCMSTPKRITLLLLNHPLETAAELLLVVSIPLAIFFTWSSFCKNNFSYSIGRGVALGASIGSALIVAAVCVAALFFGSSELASAIGTEFTTGFCWIAFLSLGAAAVGAFLVNRIRLTRDFQASRLQVIAFTVTGMLLSAVTFVAAEYRPWAVRLAEVKAVSAKAEVRNQGLMELRALLPERELRMECSDSRAAGIAGLFMPLKSASERELYFAVSGKPFSFKEFANKDVSFMPDDDLQRLMVGDKVSGLSLIRSTMDGAVHPETLSSTVNWTFVFKNGTSVAQEVRSELGLPPGAVITNLSLWNHGERQDATIAAAGKAEGYADAAWRQVNLNSPAVVSDLGHGRMLLHCYPVSPDEEMKVALTMVVPLKPDGAKAASLVLPTFISSNFDLKGFNHQLKLHSPNALSASIKNLAAGVMTGGEKTIGGNLTDEQLESSNLNIRVARTEQLRPIVVLDKTAVALAREDEKKRAEKQKREMDAASAQAERQIIVMIDGSKGVNGQIADVTRALDGKPAGRLKRKPVIKTIPPHYVVENVERVADPAPKHLVVVVDGSDAVKKYAGELSASLAKLPPGISAELIIASQEKEKLNKAVPLAQGLAELKESQFVGGQNNLQSVVNAAELAGQSKGGAVLWVHGPQPALNEEIYIMSQFAAKPSFYELQVGTGDTDTFDFFKNHSEIGPFVPVPRNANNLSKDLGYFFAKWQPYSNDYEVSFSKTTVAPENGITVSDQEAQELLALSASRDCADLLANRHIRKAARIAVAYGVVSSVSCALVSTNDGAVEENVEETEGTAQCELKQQGASASANPQNAPSLSGATNGTIGQQGADATIVMGVNTAGTVRVNNLANLEALLNIIANLAEIGGALTGLVIAIHGLARRETIVTEFMGREVEISSGQRVAFGICLILLGLAVPGLINWFVASARDACLFN